MGWTYWGAEPRGTDEILRDEFRDTKIRATAIVGGVWYAAVQPKDKTYTTALVVLTERKGAGFGYKPMSEEMGPHAVRCPPSIIALLSPVEELDVGPQGQEWARLWREACARETEGLPNRSREMAR